MQTLRGVAWGALLWGVFSLRSQGTQKYYGKPLLSRESLHIPTPIQKWFTLHGTVRSEIGILLCLNPKKLVTWASGHVPDIQYVSFFSAQGYLDKKFGYIVFQLAEISALKIRQQGRYGSGGLYCHDAATGSSAHHRQRHHNGAKSCALQTKGVTVHNGSTVNWSS